MTSTKLTYVILILTVTFLILLYLKMYTSLFF